MEDLIERIGLVLRLSDGATQFGLTETVGRADVHTAAPRGDRSEAVLRLARMSDLAYREHIERHREMTCDLGGDRNSPASETHGDSIPENLAVERYRELPAGVGTIVKQSVHGTNLAMSDRPHCYDHARPDGSPASPRETMANDPDALFPSGPTTRRGLLSVFSRRAAEALPVRESVAPGDTGDPFEEEPPDSIEPLVSGEELIAEVHASADETGMHIWWLGQSGFLVQINGENLLLDPYLSDSLTTKYAGTDTPHERITGLVVEPALLSFVDVVTSSHAHGDHLDEGTLPHVLAGEAAFVCAAGSEHVAAERAGRLPDAVLGIGDGANFGGFRIEAVPAYHEGAPEAVGYVIRNGAYALYHAGDSRRVQGMAEAVAPHGVDVAFVPINGKFGNMHGADAARLAFEAAAYIAIPCHHEMFRFNTATTSRFVAECVRIGEEYRLPRAGERITIDYGF
jgi:L-ascorbate metabolism protein UlaG (beta-lactamase superfamily)